MNPVLIGGAVLVAILFLLRGGTGAAASPDSAVAGPSAAPAGAGGIVALPPAQGIAPAQSSTGSGDAGASSDPVVSTLSAEPTGTSSGPQYNYAPPAAGQVVTVGGQSNVYQTLAATPGAAPVYTAPGAIPTAGTTGLYT